ncbi:PEGA domain-containing protein [Candidatus Saccharibacteria bacterium]|nr:PEGA domain-containing protein [Candidatus Saccharibacteria bacterium]
MEPEQRARRAKRRVIISEAIMLVAVIATVAILAFLVSGYWVGSDFKVERQGLLQISSIPTGADVEIDGELGGFFQRTNTSKVLSAGEHNIKLTKEGYDSWARTINVAEGLLYRIHYPRLFLEKRDKTSVFTATTATFATVSPSRAQMLLASTTTTWTLLNLENDKLDPRTIELPADFPFTSRTTADATSPGIFSGEIKSAEWAYDNEHLLLELADATTTKWVLINVRDPKATVDLTATFNANFSVVKIADHSASNLLAVKDGNLHRIDLSSRQLSAVLVADVADFDYYDSTIIFSAKSSATPADSATSTDPSIASGDSSQDSPATAYYVGLTSLSDSKITSVRSIDTPALVAISKFYDDEYLTIVTGNSLAILKKTDFSVFLEQTIDTTPQSLKVGKDGSFVALKDDKGHITVVDMEARAVLTWSPVSNHFGWLDGYMVYAVDDNSLLHVYDFDGENHRTLSSGVSSRFPVTISADKWLYYFKDGDLIRETIAK